MSEQPRLLFCCFDVLPAPNGLSRRITEYLKGLAQGFQVVVLSTKTPDHSHIERYHGARLLRVPVGAGDLPSRIQAFDRAVKRQLESEEYEVAHFFDPFAGYALCEARAHHGFRLVYDAQSFPSQELRHTQPEIEADRRFLAKVRRQELFCLMNADAVICGSETSREWIISLGAPKTSLHVFRQPVDLAAYAPAVVGRPDGSPMKLLYLGSPLPYQGLETLLRAMQVALRDVDLRLLVVGPKAPDGQASYDDLVGALKLTGKIEFLGPVPHEELPKVLSTVDVGVAPLEPVDRNTTQGGALAKVAEYLAAGRPVVASDLPLVRELVPESARLVFPPGDFKALANQLVRIAGDKARRLELGEAARAAASRFDAASVQQRLIALYGRLAARGRAASPEESPAEITELRPPLSGGDGTAPSVRSRPRLPSEPPKDETPRGPDMPSTDAQAECSTESTQIVVQRALEAVVPSEPTPIGPSPALADEPPLIGAVGRSGTLWAPGSLAEGLAPITAARRVTTTPPTAAQVQATPSEAHAPGPPEPEHSAPLTTPLAEAPVAQQSTLPSLSPVDEDIPDADGHVEWVGDSETVLSEVPHDGSVSGNASLAPELSPEVKTAPAAPAAPPVVPSPSDRVGRPIFAAAAVGSPAAVAPKNRTATAPTAPGSPASPYADEVSTVRPRPSVTAGQPASAPQGPPVLASASPAVGPTRIEPPPLPRAASAASTEPAAGAAAPATAVAAASPPPAPTASAPRAIFPPGKKVKRTSEGKGVRSPFAPGPDEPEEDQRRRGRGRRGRRLDSLRPLVGAGALWLLPSPTLPIRAAPSADDLPRPERLNMLVDLSHTLVDGLVTYPGLPALRVCDFMTREASRGRYAPGVEFHIGQVELVANTGTYVDAPFHRWADGADVSELPLDTLADLPGLRFSTEAKAIGPELFDGTDVRGHAVLVHTGWCRHFGTPAYGSHSPYLTAAAASFLKERGVKLVGIDALNIDDIADPERPVHSTLLRAGIPICEHLTGLEQLPRHGFRFSAVPVKVKGLGTFPVRAFASL